VRHGENALHRVIEALPGFRAFDVFRLTLHPLHGGTTAAPWQASA
jgi:hypothetical protein